MHAGAEVVLGGVLARVAGALGVEAQQLHAPAVVARRGPLQKQQRPVYRQVGRVAGHEDGAAGDVHADAGAPEEDAPDARGQGGQGQGGEEEPRGEPGHVARHHHHRRRYCGG
ncbi:hypothetical protein EG863_15255, partial [Enterococcus faecalis]